MAVIVGQIERVGLPQVRIATKEATSVMIHFCRPIELQGLYLDECGGLPLIQLIPCSYLGLAVT